MADAEEDHVAVARLPDFDVDAVAVLFGVDRELLDRVLRRAALFELADPRSGVARPDFDGAVEGREVQLRRPGDGEALFLAGDVPLRVGDPARGAERQRGGEKSCRR